MSSDPLAGLSPFPMPKLEDGEPNPLAELWAWLRRRMPTFYCVKHRVRA